ncbi:MAG: alpha/beta hydrolase [Myxococcota bacterium]
MLGTCVHGAGPHTVVMLHDWMGDHRNYDFVLPLLDTEAYRWVFADLRGYGLSRDLAGSHTLEEAASDVGALIDTLGPVRLVGHSMSSLVAQQVATERPLERLVLVSPVDPTGMKTPKPVVAWLEQVAGDLEARQALAERFAARHGPRWAAFKLAHWADSASVEAARGYVRMYSEQTVQGKRPNNDPIGVILGEHDAEPFEVASVTAMLKREWPRAEVRICPSAGHYPMQETPPAFAAALHELLT